ncbi:urease accessory protein UreD [Streptomyces sp. NPDC003077]|uniref:urease accessory protein UreD n=1 Tax=Streptomyces sp. NPDC003077 TaxID=3154443 RepID=UPI0033B2D882
MTLAPPPAPAPDAIAPAPAPASGLRATARVVARAAAGGPVRLPVLDGDGPFALRRVRSSGDQAGVCVVGAMSAPLGGDRLRMEITAEPGASLRVTAAAATVALPGRTGAEATYDVELTVGEGARLDWLPEPLVSAEGSDLRMTTTVRLAPTARLVLREEQVLGRAGERTGRLRSRLVVRRAGRVLLDQETAYGPGVPGWDSAAVLGGHRAVGQLLVVDPAYERDPLPTRLLGEAEASGKSDAAGRTTADAGAAAGYAVCAPLAGPAALVTAVAPDALALRRLLESASIPTGW